MSKDIRKKRIRRQNKQSLRYGKSAKPTHNLISGRTGAVHYKKTKQSKRIDINESR